MRGIPIMKNKLISFAVFLSCVFDLFACNALKNLETGKPIKVGVLHSLTGTMAISESSVKDATLFAIEEINSQGGLLRRKIVPVVADGQSDGAVFAREAERLIAVEKVSVVFGCWTSASRKTVKPVFEQHHHLLFYPVQYEGLEQSPNIVYTGATPNQQIIPAVKWAFENLGKRIFLVGSDYVFPRVANEIVRDQAAILGGQIVGEEYLPLGSQDVKELTGKIADTRPEVIINTINGDSNIAFFRELVKLRKKPGEMPTLSFSIAEEELRFLDPKNLAGDYACWNYFQCIDSERNRTLVNSFKKRFGKDRVMDDPLEAAYFGVYLWAQAVVEAGSENVHEVRKSLPGQSFDAPEGIVVIDPYSSHTWKTVRIGKIRPDGQFEIVWSSEKPIPPVPYPLSRSNAEWNQFLDQLYRSWGNRWANPNNRQTN